jgi:hypothetical protein
MGAVTAGLWAWVGCTSSNVGGMGAGTTPDSSSGTGASSGSTAGGITCAQFLACLDCEADPSVDCAQESMLIEGYVRQYGQPTADEYCSSLAQASQVFPATCGLDASAGGWASGSGTSSSGSGGSGSTASSGAGSPSSSGSSAVGTMDAATDSGPALAATGSASGGSADAGGCFDVVNAAPKVTAITIDGTDPLPVAMGGQIASGTYYVTSYESYEPGATSTVEAYTPGTFEQETVVVDARTSTTGVWNLVVNFNYSTDGGPDTVQRDCKPYDISGSSPTFVAGLPYSATPTGFSIYQFVAGEANVTNFTKQ